MQINHVYLPRSRVITPFAEMGRIQSPSRQHEDPLTLIGQQQREGHAWLVSAPDTRLIAIRLND